MKSWKKALRLLLSIAFWVLVWEAAAFGVGNSLLFPTPRIVLRTLWELMKTPLFWKVTGLSLWNVLSGILWALVPGSYESGLPKRLILIDPAV